MIPLEIEIFFLTAQIMYLARMYYQTKESKKRKDSVNPKVFWQLSIVAGILITIYGYLIGSTVMVVTQILGIFYSIYHIHLIEPLIYSNYEPKCATEYKRALREKEMKVSKE